MCLIAIIQTLATMCEIKINPLPMREGYNKCKLSKAAIGAELVGIDESPLMERMDQLARSAEREILKMGLVIYNVHLQTPAVSINRLCTIISFDIPTKSKSFFRATYHIYRHFVVRHGFQINDLLGINFRILRFIAESAEGTFDQETTSNTIHRIKSENMSNKAALSYAIEVKKTRQEYLTWQRNF